MQKLFTVGGLLGALLWVLPGCSSNPGACQKESDCGPGEYCALGICKRPLGTTGASAGSSTSGTTGGTTGTATESAATGTASGSSTGLASSTGGSSTGTTGGTSSGAGTTGTTGGTVSSNYCKPCTQQSDCGDAGGLCYQLGDDNYYCLTDCSATMTCTETGAVCVPTDASDGGFLGYDCLPETDLCPAADGGAPDGGGASDGGDPYCQACMQNSDCGTSGAMCVSFEYQETAFCAPDCTTSGVCAEAGAMCDPLNGANMSVCAPTSRLCPGADPYCLVCMVNTDCGNGAVCTTLDDFDYFCATTCTVKAGCSEANAECDAITDVNGNPADGCVPTALSGGACPGAPD